MVEEQVRFNIVPLNYTESLQDRPKLADTDADYRADQALRLDVYNHVRGAPHRSKCAEYLV